MKSVQKRKRKGERHLMRVCVYNLAKEKKEV